MIFNEQLKHISKSGLSRMPKNVADVLINSISELEASGLSSNIAGIGDTISNIQLENNEGGLINIKELIRMEFLIINFYRGGWCPYCNVELRAYEQLKTEFEKINVGIVAISSERPELANKTGFKNNLSYPTLTDVDAKFMKSIGIVFQLNESLKKEYTNFGIDLAQIHNSLKYELPVPAVYVINKKLEIVFVHFEENYMARLDPQDLLKNLNNIF